MCQLHRGEYNDGERGMGPKSLLVKFEEGEALVEDYQFGLVVRVRVCVRNVARVSGRSRVPCAKCRPSPFITQGEETGYQEKPSPAVPV